MKKNELPTSHILPLIMTTKVFEHAHQIAFANASKDWNPLHMDPVQARRFISGAQVVHGINILLTAIDATLASNVHIGSITRVCCDFKVVINLGEEITFVLSENDADHAVIDVMIESVICTKITLYFVDSLPFIEKSISSWDGTWTNLDSLNEPLDLSEQECRGFTATIGFDCEQDAPFTSLYPQLTNRYGSFFCQAFSRLSYIVGMICPGLHSIFLSLDIAIPQNWTEKRYLKFHVSNFEERVKLFELTLDEGALVGKIRAFRRPTPVAQIGIDEIESLIQVDEFKHMRSFVIGGSRGLGELMSKILCAGGGSVILGYSVGKTDAVRVRSEIEKSRPDACSIQQFDVRHDMDDDLTDMLVGIDSVFYFPTPSIFKKINSVFSEEIFQNFLEYYVFSFYRLCRQLEMSARKKIKIYYPSSIFVTDRPNGMTEYAMAKAAGELMINDMNRTFHKIEIHTTRLPRLKSDQTNSIFHVKTEENTEYLLSIAREMHGL